MGAKMRTGDSSFSQAVARELHVFHELPGSGGPPAWATVEQRKPG